MLELGSRQNLTDMDTKRVVIGKCIANALVCQLCWIFLFLLVALWNWASISNGYRDIWIRHDLDILVLLDVIGYVTIWYLMCSFLNVLHCNQALSPVVFELMGPDIYLGPYFDFSGSRDVSSVSIASPLDKSLPIGGPLEPSLYLQPFLR